MVVPNMWACALAQVAKGQRAEVQPLIKSTDDAKLAQLTSNQEAIILIIAEQIKSTKFISWS